MEKYDVVIKLTTHLRIKNVLGYSPETAKDYVQQVINKGDFKPSSITLNNKNSVIVEVTPAK